MGPRVTLFFLPLAVMAILVVLAVLLAASVFRAARSLVFVRRGEFRVTPESVAPGEGLRVWARVEPRRNRPIVVRATLACTLFDHRARRLYANTLVLAPVVGQADCYAAFVQMPAYALRTGVVGDDLSRLFSEEAHRLLVYWSVDFEVLGTDANVVLLRQSIPVEVPNGRPLEADRTYMEQLVVSTCGAMRSDLVLNWLVRLAGADGVIAPSERQLLHDVLRVQHGVTEPAAADARIAVELARDLGVDGPLLRKHLAQQDLLAFYRVLYAMAWRDGAMDGREHNFLIDSLERFGLDPSMVHDIEGEVLRGMAQHAIR